MRRCKSIYLSRVGGFLNNEEIPDEGLDSFKKYLFGSFTAPSPAGTLESINNKEYK